MSFLRSDDRSSRRRDKSATRERSRSDVYAPSAPSPPGSNHYGYAPPPPKQTAAMPGSFSNGDTSPTYEVRAPAGVSDRHSKYAPPSSAASKYTPKPTSNALSKYGAVPYPEDGGFTMGDYTDFPPEERPGYIPPAGRARFPSMPKDDSDDDLAYGDPGAAARFQQSRHASYSNPYPQDSPFPNMPSDPAAAAYRYTPQDHRKSDSRSSSYANYQYAAPPEKITYTAKPVGGHQPPVPHSRDPRDRDLRDRDLKDRDSRERELRERERELRERERELRDRDLRDRDRDRDPRDRDPRDRDPKEQHSGALTRKYSQNDHYDHHERNGSLKYRDGANVVEIKPGGHDSSDRRDGRDRKDSSARGGRLSISTPHSGMPPPIAAGLGAGMGMLSVGGGRDRSDSHGGGMPPPSPLLEAYRGTYQSISPMPLAIRPTDDDDLSDIEPLDAPPKRSSKKNDKLERDARSAKDKDSKGSKDSKDKDKKRVKVYDSESDAKTIASALKHSKVDADKLIDVLPGLSHDQIWEVRKEYKKQVKIQGKGINLPKHLKMKLTGNFGKVVYVTALGRWESEGYWANFWYQSHGSRRELLIESLMGRTNSEIGYIKDEFKDKRYGDSLVKCMEKELKMDKFRTAVLMALEERRQDEQDVYPQEYRNRDVDTLHRALTARQGGETAMLEIIIRRSDAHLREVLRTYERMHQENFARAALKKSNNLVGEVIAHILNGVINKPARDALLIRHAIKDIAAKNKDDELRYELLISRLVRLHWDKLHLMRVEKEYYEKFGETLQDDIEEGVRDGDFKEFLIELCEVK